MSHALECGIGELAAGWAAHGDRPALIHEGRRVGHRELVEDAGRLGTGLLELGLRPGDRLAFLLPNGVEIMSCYLACALTGLVGVPLSPRLTVDDLAHQLEDSGAAVLVHAERWRDTAAQIAARWTGLRCLVSDEPAGERGSLHEVRALGRPVTDVAVEPDDPFTVMYTGGTTGGAKAVVQTQRAWAACVLDTVEQFSLRGDDRHAIVLPMTHAAWFSAAAHLHVGAVTHVLESWQPDAYLDLVVAERLSVLHLIPTLLGDALESLRTTPRDMSRVRLLTLAGAPIPVEMFRRAHEEFGQIVGNIYGLTEAAGPVTYLVPGDMDEGRLRSGGRAGRYVEISLLDAAGDPEGGPVTGEIALRGAQVTPGYLNRPEETAATFRDGWFCTGDIGYVDDDGFLFVVDRKKDMVKTGGFNVFPKEIEEVLYRHPDVVEAAVIGVPDPRWMEALVAFVVLGAGATSDPEAIVAHCRAHLPGYKTPRIVRIVDALPRTAFGKFDKPRLRREHGPS